MFNFKKIYGSDASGAGRDFHLIVFPKINSNFEGIQNDLSNFLGLTGGTISGNLYVSTISAATYYSGSTLLETVIRNIASTYSGGTGTATSIQNGANTFTGGTASSPTINITAATLSSITVSGSSSFSSISASTYFSGSTPLETIINTVASALDSHIQNGTNTFTGGTTSNPTVNITAATLNNLTVSGGTSLASLSATTYFSGSTPLQTIINNIASTYSGGTATSVQNGTNTFTGGTASSPTVNITAATLNNLTVSGSSSFSSLTASTIFGDGTGLTGVAHAFTGTTTLNFGSAISGETSYCLTSVTNNNINSTSIVNIRVTTSTNHPDVEDSLLDELTFTTSDIVDGVGFTINCYASQDSWGEYNVMYKILN